ncbi:hypothetical protein [Microvirga puerhi]|uniref:Lipoprotein n=1 Tax=Microvirga puerhi TaxID=2876078 RepID=A0ABS7VIU5_9HYPH|nr:hypothetical protein [Microvirga puerhi]MBZ6074982.1 hypothetical protein [Microvirga puerhi]
MRIVIFILAVSLFLAGCMSNPEAEYRPPNYVASQATQAPAMRNDGFGGAAMPMRGLYR